MKQTIYALLFSSFIFLTAFNKNGQNVVNPTPTPPEQTQQLKDLVNSSNSFAIDIFKLIESEAKINENVFISPFSINHALYMALIGANGETRDEILKTLKLTEAQAANLNQNAKLLFDILTNNNKSQNLFLANSFWINKDYIIKENYQNLLKNYFYSEGFTRNFSDPNTLREINNWIAAHTGDMIKDMLDKIPGGAVLYLINAIYFKDNWQIQFDKSKTRDVSFYNKDRSTANVRMMLLQDSTLRRYSDENFKAIELPYSKSNTNMIIIQPYSNSSSNDYMSLLTLNKVNHILANLKAKSTLLSLPKFNLKTKYLLNDILSKLGIKKAFKNAEFWNISDIGIFISRVLHDAAIEVDEAGTRASASTIIEFREKSSNDEEFSVYQPFIFFITDKTTNAILFAGKVNDLTVK